MCNHSGMFQVTLTDVVSIIFVLVVMVVVFYFVATFLHYLFYCAEERLLNDPASILWNCG